MRRAPFVIVVAIVLSLLAPVVAQNAPSEYIAVTSVSVRPAAFADFEDYVKKLNAAAAKIGLKTRVDAYQTAQGGSVFHYDFVAGFPTLSALDQEPGTTAIVMKAYGDAEGAKILRAGRATLESVETEVLQFRAEFSSKAREVRGSPFFQLVRTEIDPAMVVQYEDYLAKIKAARDKHTATGPSLRHTSTFGQSFVYFHALPFANYAERAKWPTPLQILTAAYGDATAQTLVETNRRATRRQDIVVVAFRRDLSRIPTPSTN